MLAETGCTSDGDEGQDETVDPTAAPDEARPAADALKPLQFADRGPKVRVLYEYLKTFGYFPNPALEEFAGWIPVIDEEPADPELFDVDIEEALFMYQLAHGLTTDGVLNGETLVLMARPRCGFLDYYSASYIAHPPARGGVSNSVNSGLRWSKSDLTYSFLNFTGDLPSGNIRSDISGALSRWTGVAPLSFREVSSGGAPEASPRLERDFPADHRRTLL